VAVRVLDFLGLDPVSRLSPGKFWLGLALVTLAGLVRGGWLAGCGEIFRDDPDTYRQLARNLLTDGVFGYRVPDAATGRLALQPTAYRPPLYPLLLAAVGWTDFVGSVSVGVLHGVMGVATVLLVFSLAQAWGLGRWAWCAALLVACDPILLRQSSLVMTETLATLLAVGGLASLTRLSRCPHRSRALQAGAVVALAGLCRPTFLVWGAAIALAMLFPGWILPGGDRQSLAPRLRLAGAFVAAMALVLSPWAIRNTRALGRPIVTTTHGGYTLWLGNNPEFYGFLQRARGGEVWDSQRLDQQYLQFRERTGYDELAADRWSQTQALGSMRDQPAAFARACIWRVRSLWGLVPQQVSAEESAAGRLARSAVGAWYAMVFGLAGVGLVALGRRRWQPPWWAALLLCLSFTAMHAVYWSNLRMRAPLMPVICLAAAAGVRRIARGRAASVSARRRRDEP
jgi:4-amino-4-deoxy-L-arabinose transferase-like glycosyltransferase